MPACRARRPRPFRSSGPTRSRRTDPRPFGSHVPLLDALLLHGGPHIGRVIPHQAGHHRGSVVATHAARQIGRQGTAFALQAVTLNALFAVEQLFAAPGVAGDNTRPWRTPDDDRAHSNHSKHEHCWSPIYSV